MSSEKPWLEVRLTSWNDFDHRLEDMGHREWLFRGHSNSDWSLRTSLDRLFDDMQPIIRSSKNKSHAFAKKTHEELIIKSFKKNANLYLKFLPDENKTFEWLSIMQHHGAPTRLLDVTLSPHIATYFALESGAGECSVFAINHTEIKENNNTILHVKTYKEMEEKIFPKKEQNKIFKPKERFIIVFNPEYGNERLVVQQGLFLVPSQIDDTFENILADYLNFTDGDVCIKFIIPQKLRLRGLERLREMNINSATLFPGIDGFSRSLRFQILETVKSQKLLE